jgi:FkbM family methyltransferase
MNVEDCCQSILSKLLPVADPERYGFAIDIGVGTFAFYCELFDRLGYQTVAVEPLPTKKLLRLCCRRHIKLIQACISDMQGDVAIFIGQFDGQENSNLSSLRQDWWGGSSKKMIVPSIKLESLLQGLNHAKVTCIKIDVEGIEFSIIRQFRDLGENSLPDILMFEYGGGDTKASGKGGWQKDIFESTVNTVELLKQLSYKQVLVNESAETKVRKFNLEDIESPVEIFDADDIYGNVIAIKSDLITMLHINSICDALSDSFQFSMSEIEESFSKKLLTGLRSVRCLFLE